VIRGRGEREEEKRRGEERKGRGEEMQRKSSKMFILLCQSH